MIQITYRRLQSTYSSPEPGHCRRRPRGRRSGCRRQTEYAARGRRRPRHSGQCRADRGDGDAHSPGVESVAETVARRCTGREPMSMASAATRDRRRRTGVRWSGARAATLTRLLLSAVVQMCRTFQKSSVSRVVRPCRDSMPGTLSSESRRRMSSMTTRGRGNAAAPGWRK